MKASIPSRHHPPQAAQKPLIWLEFSLVRVARRGAAVAVAVAGVAAIQVLCCGGGETEESYWGKSQTPNPETPPRATETQRLRGILVLCVSVSLRPVTVNGVAF